MDPQTLTNRVEILERKVEELANFPIVWARSNRRFRNCAPR